MKTPEAGAALEENMITRLSIAIVLAALLALPAEAAVDPSAEAAALTSLLAEYLAADGQTDLAASLRSLDPSSAESRALLESAVGPKIFDFGARMFGWFEEQATSSQRGVETRPWATFESEHFLFAYRPGSVAGRDRALIASAAEDTWVTVGSSFDLATAVEENGTLIANRTPDGSDEATTAKIVVTLHPFRSDDTAKRLKGPSLGTTSLGATRREGVTRLRADIRRAARAVGESLAREPREVGAIPAQLHGSALAECESSAVGPHSVRPGPW